MAYVIGLYDPNIGIRPVQTGDVPVEYVYPILGACCFSIGIYTEGIHIIGCASRALFLSSNWEQLTCKPARRPNSTNSCCTTNRTKCECFWPLTFFKFLDQIFCFDFRFGIPCDDDAPFLFNICGYTVFYKSTEFVGECCLSYRDLKTRYDGFEGPAPIPFRKLVEEQLKHYK